MGHILLLFRVGLFVLISLPACGYQFGVEGRGPTIGGARVVQFEGPPVVLAIDPLENRTFERDLEIKYSQYLRRQFKLTSGAEVVRNPQDADFLLRGAIESVSLPSLTFTQNQTQESRVSVQVKVEVKNRRTGKVLWVQTANGTAEFFVSASPEGEGGQSGLQFNRILQNRALEQAGQEVAINLSDRFLIAREKGVFNPPPPPEEKMDQETAAPETTPTQSAPLSEPRPKPDMP